jgi:hypothetical protein
MNDAIIKQKCDEVCAALEARLRKPYNRNRYVATDTWGPGATIESAVNLLAHTIQRTLDETPIAKNGVVVEVGGWIECPDGTVSAAPWHGTIARVLNLQPRGVGTRHYATLRGEKERFRVPVDEHTARPPTRDKHSRLVDIGDLIESAEGVWEPIRQLQFIDGTWGAYSPTRLLTLGNYVTRPAPKDRQGRLVAAGDEIECSGGRWQVIDRLIYTTFGEESEADEGKWVAYSTQNYATVSLYSTRARVVVKEVPEPVLFATAKNGVRVEVGCFLRIESTWRRIKRFCPLNPLSPIPPDFTWAEIDGLAHYVSVENYDGSVVELTNEPVAVKRAGDAVTTASATDATGQPYGKNGCLVEVGGALLLEYRTGDEDGWIDVTEVSHHLGEWFAWLADGSYIRVAYHVARPAPRDKYGRAVVAGDEILVLVSNDETWTTVRGVSWIKGVYRASVALSNSTFVVDLASATTRPAQAIGKNGVVAEVGGRLFSLDGSFGQASISSIFYSGLDREWFVRAASLGRDLGLYRVATHDLQPAPRDVKGRVVAEGDYAKGTGPNPIKLLRIMMYDDGTSLGRSFPGAYVAFVAPEDIDQMQTCYVEKLETASAQELGR